MSAYGAVVEQRRLRRQSSSAKKTVGQSVALINDQLQAETAAAQATLDRVRATNDSWIPHGTLATRYGKRLPEVLERANRAGAAAVDSGDGAAACDSYAWLLGRNQPVEGMAVAVQAG